MPAVQPSTQPPDHPSSLLPQPRSCHGTNKQGQPCRSRPRTDSNYCQAHDPALAEDKRFGSAIQARNAAKLGGRPRRPKELELLQQVAEKRIRELEAVYAEGLTAERSVVVGDGRFAHLESMADHAQRLKTAEALLDRLHGKPRTAGEGKDQNVVVNLAVVQDPAAREAAAELRRALAAGRGAAIEARTLP